jgi:hypothetical protein
MSLFHAVVLIDHQQAQVLQFDAEHVQASRIKTHQHFSHVCDALEGVSEVLVTGSKTALADFRHYIEKHRVPTSQRVVGFETVDQPTQHQLVALARQYFLRYDRMAGTPTPT